MKLFFTPVLLFLVNTLFAQPLQTYSSSEILHRLQKLEVFGTVLYIAAHPDDENTRLLSYLENERKLRTAYLSLTRGDGGQNLIGDEQGIELGLIRTQELLAARRIDGAEQYFTRAYDFGYSKSPEETLEKWGHDKILSDVVWIIRKLQPDVIIARFPTTGEGGHGHHTASAILAGEAFDAAADPAKFPEQFSYGVKPWKAKRLLWNSFNWGGSSVDREGQFKTDVGMYNPLLGKSYGEMAAESRSQHRSQGMGATLQRGESFEFFLPIKGDKPTTDIMENIETGPLRIPDKLYGDAIKKIISAYNPQQPSLSLPALIQLKQLLFKVKGYDNLVQFKIKEIDELIDAVSGLFLEATVSNQLNVVGDSLHFTVTFNNRNNLPVESAQVSVFGQTIRFTNLSNNINNIQKGAAFILKETPVSQPYWIEYPLEGEAFQIKNQQKTGLPEILNDNFKALFQVQVKGTLLTFSRNIQYKHTDPVKGELYQPAQFVYPVFINSSPSLILLRNNQDAQKKLTLTVQPNMDLSGKMTLSAFVNNKPENFMDTSMHFSKGTVKTFNYVIHPDKIQNNSTTTLGMKLSSPVLYEDQMYSLRKIAYDHIPDIFYHYYDQIKIIKLDIKTSGKAIGYITGAGDKVPQALEQMGYTVTFLQENDFTVENLRRFDAIVTGVRAYNVNAWMDNVYEPLMNYVKAGGVLLVQYNTNNNIGKVTQRLFPYPFEISRTRVTDEIATVRFLESNHPLLNYPNKISTLDFDGWVQERSTYQAEKTDERYQRILSMNDPGEKPGDGSLIAADYGKGRLIYCGLSFFRQLPAGVPGAYRLMANLLAKPEK